MPMTAILAVSADGRFEVFRIGEDMPTGRQWEAVRFERPGLAHGGGDLVWYVARTRAIAARLAAGRAVFVESELQALRPLIASLANADVADLLADLVALKTLSGSAAVVGASLPADRVVIKSAAILTEALVIEAPPVEPAPRVATQADLLFAPPLPEGI
jgi:hypothetical protein